MWDNIIPALSAIAVAVIELIAARDRKKVKANQAQIEKRAKLRAEEGRLQLQMLSATMQLSTITANAMTGGHNNGNVEKAREASDAAVVAYDKFCRGVTNDAIAK